MALPDLTQLARQVAKVTGTSDMTPAENSASLLGVSTAIKCVRWRRCETIDDLGRQTASPCSCCRRGRGGGSCINAPDRTRTCDLWFRKPPLYPTELRAQLITEQRLMPILPYGHALQPLLQPIPFSAI